MKKIKTSLAGWLRSFAGLVKRLGGAYDHYSGAAAVPCPDVEKALSVVGRFYSPDYRAAVTPGGRGYIIIFIPREIPEGSRKEAGLRRYLLKKLEERG